MGSILPAACAILIATRRATVFLVSTILLWAAHASAEVLFLRDGSRVSGRLTQCDEEHCVISSKRVPMETIERIELVSGVEPPAGGKDGSIVLADGTIHNGRFLGLNLGVVDTDKGEVDREGVALIVVKAAAPVAAPQEKRRPSPDLPLIAPVELPGECAQAHQRADRLRSELEAALSAQAKAGAEQYVAKPGPGVDAVKAWGDYAAGALLADDVPIAAWAGLKAASIRWNGETVTDAGVYLIHLGKTTEALQLLSCAYAMNYRSPYLFEALAVIHQTRGNSAEARRAISQAQQMEPDDIIIATEASFLNTGQPPPPPPPQPARDGLDEAVRELAEHGERALNLIKLQADELDRSFGDNSGSEQYRIAAEFVNNLVTGARDQGRDARAATDAAARAGMTNAVLQYCISSYALISDALLSFPDSIETSGGPLLLWAEVLGLDSPVLARETERKVSSWSPGPTLAQGAYEKYARDRDAAHADYGERVRACRDDTCTVREEARFCGVWQQLYATWETASQQRYNTAARGFDRIATRRLMHAENEWLRVRDYAVRQLRKMRFQKVPGFDMEEMTVQAINLAILPVYQKHVNPSEGIDTGTVLYLRERAQSFEGARSGMEAGLAAQAEQMKQWCEPVMQALLELLAQEEWQAYLDHLRDRLAWDIEAMTEKSDCPPGKFSIGPLSVSADLSKFGEGKFDYKYEKGGFTAKGTATVGGDRGLTLKGEAEGKIRGVTIGVNSEGESSISRDFKSDPIRDSDDKEASFGIFKGKGQVTLTSKKNPYNNREYMGIKLKGSVGFGLGSKWGKRKVGLECYPSSGSVTFYPRAILEDAARYLSTPSTPPGR